MATTKQAQTEAKQAQQKAKAEAKQAQQAAFDSAFASAGPSISKSEALQISKSSGKSVAEVMNKALQIGAMLESSVVNAYNKGTFGPTNANAFGDYGVRVVPGVTNRDQARAIQQLAPLDGLRMQPKMMYAGYSTTTSPGGWSGSGDGAGWYPGRTSYSPIVLPMGYAPAAPAPAPAPAPADPVADWEQSVNDGNQALIDAINEQIKANSAQAELYMGQINTLMQSMTQANQNAGLQSITPYAVTSTTVDPASGAKTTQAITPRKKPLDTDLSISPLVSSTAGTGLNIGI
jgi:hypothetical protein